MDAARGGVIDYLVFKPASPIRCGSPRDSAALRFQVSFDLVVGGDTHVTHQGWITELYERRHGRWQIVWEQATAIPNDFGLFVGSIKPVSSLQVPGRRWAKRCAAPGWRPRLLRPAEVS